MHDVSLFRLYLLRAMYLLVVVGLGIVVWPGIIQPAAPWGTMEGVVKCMLAAFSILCAFGLRYPLQMLPMLLWELIWKVLWLGIVALPMWAGGSMDRATAGIVTDCLFVIIVPFVVPWRYVYAHYVSKAADPWRLAAPRHASERSA